MSETMWQKHYEVGIPAIDEQHKKLVGMISRLRDSFDEDGGDQGGPVIGQILKELVEYTQYHFKFEEEYMARMKYPDLESHRKMHKGMIRQIREILLNLREGGDLTRAELIEFLQNWLVGHIVAEDKKIGRDLHTKIAVAKRSA